MDEKDKIIENSQEEMVVLKEITEENKEPPKAIEDPDEPLTDMSLENLNILLKQLSEMVSTMRQIWMTTQKEFKLTPDIMNALVKYNSDHLTQLPEGATEEEEAKWDKCNGIDGITEEEVVEIVGKEDHPIIGVTHDVTKDRIKEALKDLYAWQYATSEYTEVHNSYMQLIEDQEENKVQELRAIAEKEEDPEKKAKMLAAVDHYYYRKRLGFLADPKVVDEIVKNRIATALNDPKKIDYWMHRTNDKLKRMKVSPKAIMQVWNFEKRYLEEKYHRVSNSLCAYFLSLCTYCKPDDKTDMSRNMVVCMIFAIDQIIRNAMPQDIREIVFDNITAFEDMMLDFIPDPRLNESEDSVPQENGRYQFKTE